MKNTTITIYATKSSLLPLIKLLTKLEDTEQSNVKPYLYQDISYRTKPFEGTVERYELNLPIDLVMKLELAFKL